MHGAAGERHDLGVRGATFNAATSASEAASHAARMPIGRGLIGSTSPFRSARRSLSDMNTPVVAAALAAAAVAVFEVARRESRRQRADALLLRRPRLREQRLALLGECRASGQVLRRGRSTCAPRSRSARSASRATAGCRSRSRSPRPCPTSSEPTRSAMLELLRRVQGHELDRFLGRHAAVLDRLRRLGVQPPRLLVVVRVEGHGARRGPTSGSRCRGSRRSPRTCTPTSR